MSGSGVEQTTRESCWFCQGDQLATRQHIRVEVEPVPRQCLLELYGEETSSPAEFDARFSALRRHYLQGRYGAHDAYNPAGPAAHTVLELQRRLRREASRPARSLVVRRRLSVSPGAGGDPVTGEVYTATPYLRRLTAANGWRGDLLRDAQGESVAVVAVRVGPRWTDSVAIAGETDTVAMRHHTRERELIVPAHLPSESGAVWQRHGRCADVLAELLELPTP